MKLDISKESEKTLLEEGGILMSSTVSQIEWDMVFNTLSDEQKSRVFDLALRLMPSEPPEPEDLEAIKDYVPQERFSFTSAREMAAYFGIAE